MVAKLIASMGRRRPWIQVLAAILIFGSGLVTGAGATFAALRTRLIPKPILGQPGGPREGRPASEDFVDRIIRSWTEDYALTEEQAAKCKTILVKNFKSLGDINTDMWGKMQKLEEEWMAKMKKILTSEQYEQWYKDFQERKERHNPGRRRGPRGGRRDLEGGRREGPGGVRGRPDPNEPFRRGGGRPSTSPNEPRPEFQSEQE